MKILKTAKQKNFRVSDYYTEQVLETLETARIISKLPDWAYPKDEKHFYVVFADDAKIIKVVCKDGYYMNAVVTKNNYEIFVEL